MQCLNKIVQLKIICKIRCLEYLFETLQVTSNCPNITLYKKLKSTSLDPVLFVNRNILKEGIHTDLTVDLKNISYDNVFF